MNFAMFLLGTITSVGACAYLLLFSRVGKSTSVKLIRALQAWHAMPTKRDAPPEVASNVNSNLADVESSLRKMGASKDEAHRLALGGASRLPSTATSDEILIAAIRLQGMNAPGRTAVN